jgi:hypothetical protein
MLAIIGLFIEYLIGCAVALFSRSCSIEPPGTRRGAKAWIWVTASLALLFAALGALFVSGRDPPPQAYENIYLALASGAPPSIPQDVTTVFAGNSVGGTAHLERTTLVLANRPDTWREGHALVFTFVHRNGNSWRCWGTIERRMGCLLAVVPFEDADFADHLHRLRSNDTTPRSNAKDESRREVVR